MRAFNAFTTVMITSILAVSQTLPTPQVITDPKQIASKPNAQVEKNLSIEKLYMTKQVGAADWSPDAKQIVFVSNISGKNNLWLVAAESGWPTQLTVSDQPDQYARNRGNGTDVVARQPLPRVHGEAQDFVGCRD